MMPAAQSGTDPVHAINATQRRTVVVSSVGLTLLCGLMFLTILRLPYDGWIDYVATGVTAVLCLVPGLVCLWRPALVLWCGNALALAVTAGVLIRITSVMHGPLFEDPSTSAFMPVFAFIPLLFMLITVLATARVALAANIGLWAGTVLISLPPIWGVLRSPDSAVQGVFQLTYFLLVGLPLTLVVLWLLVRARRNLQREQELVRELASTREHLTQAVRGGGVGLWQREPGDDGVMWWSDRMYEMLGLDSASPATTAWLRGLAHPEDRAVFEVLEAAETIASFDHTVRLRQPDGAYRWYALKGEAVPTADGGIRLAGALLDVHKRKHAELALHEARQLLDNIIRYAPLFIYAKDRESRYLLVNPTWAHVLGVDDPDAVTGQPDDAFVPAELARQYRDDDQRVMTTKQLLNRQVSMVVDGTTRTMLSAKFPLRDIHGEVSGVAGVAVDITELQDAKERLEALHAELEQFVYIVSHDLSAPLRAIRGFNDLFRQRFGSELPEGSDEYLEQIQKGADTMSNMLGAMLELSRATRNGGPFRSIEMDELLGGVFADLADSFSDGPVYLCLGSLPPLFGEPTQLMRVLRCLVHNALKFRRQDGPVHIHLHGELIQAGTRVRYQLRDNGIGFKPAHAERMFRVYQRLNPESRYPGMGMGLAVAEKIVRAHDGRISAEGEPGRGACITFELPAPPR